MNSNMLVAPTEEPVAISTAKSFLRIDNDFEDDLVGALIVSARMVLEAATRRQFISQTWRLEFDRWPFTDDGFEILAPPPQLKCKRNALRLPFAPVRNVAKIGVCDAAGIMQPVDPSLWRMDGAPDSAEIVFTSAPPLPARREAAIQIDVSVGYGGAAFVPAPLTQAILHLATYWYENRGDADSFKPEGLPQSVASLIAPYRRGRLT